MNALRVFVIGGAMSYRAIRAAALGGNPWPGIAWSLALAAVYLAIGQGFLRIFERRAREKASLSLV